MLHMHITMHLEICNLLLRVIHCAESEFVLESYIRTQLPMNWHQLCVSQILLLWLPLNFKRAKAVSELCLQSFEDL